MSGKEVRIYGPKAAVQILFSTAELSVTRTVSRLETETIHCEMGKLKMASRIESSVLRLSVIRVFRPPSLDGQLLYLANESINATSP
jgi:hypothetical protein